MPKNTKSFFERLAGNLGARDENEEENEELEEISEKTKNKEAQEQPEWIETEEGDGQLTVDMYQTPSEIIIKSMLAGVKSEELDVSINQDMVIIKGRRENVKEVTNEDYYYKELYWGGFSRSILLPQEIDAEKSEATMKDGLLTIRLPKIDKEKTQKIKIRKE